MKTNDFMNANLTDIKIMIKSLNNEFDSHDFIMAFAKEFEPQYVYLLNLHKKNAHRILHAQISLYLSKNKDYFEIDKNGKVISNTVFGFNNPNELWSKINVHLYS
ncbi:hypothetical protein [Flavobacterium terrisoli]|uniref:hypothetical protein n=1 Tax=Flavobacterium terrisoli TaxID=3242195 RepID=UPI00254292BC|nr:hypothetical protein [Flavobacterium buctense]